MKFKWNCFNGIAHLYFYIFVTQDELRKARRGSAPKPEVALPGALTFNHNNNDNNGTDNINHDIGNNGTDNVNPNNDNNESSDKIGRGVS